MIRASLVAVLLATAAPACADDLSDLTAKYVAWRGGAAFEQMTSLHQKGTIETAGLSGTFEAWSGHDGRARQDVDLKVVKVSNAYADGQGWSLTPSGQVEAVAPAQVEDARRSAVTDYADLVEGRAGATLSLQGEETRDGGTWKVVRASFGGADVYDLYIDPATGALDGLRTTIAGRTSFQRMTDWRMVNGVRLAYALDTKAETAAGDQTVRLTVAEPNPGLPAELFARPAAAGRTTFAGGVHTTGWIDFDFFNGARIFIPAKVNGHETQVVLDTGAEASALDRAFATEVGAVSQGAAQAGGFGQTTTMGIANHVAIEVGALRLSDLTVGVIDLSGVAERAGHVLTAILGKEALNELIVDFDFANHRIAFSDPQGYAPPAGAVEVKAIAVNGGRTIPVSVEGDAPGLMQFDLGSIAALSLAPAYWRAHHLDAGRRASRSVAGGIGGSFEQTVVSTRTVTVGGVTIRNVPTDLTPEGVSSQETDKVIGNIGMPLLSRFRVITDYPHDRVWLVPDVRAAATPVARDRTGLTVVKRGDRLHVDFVSPGSPGQAAGIHRDDEITAIDGKPITSAGQGGSAAPWRKAAAGSRVTLTMADGRRRVLVLKDYF